MHKFILIILSVCVFASTFYFVLPKEVSISISNLQHLILSENYSGNRIQLLIPKKDDFVIAQAKINYRFDEGFNYFTKQISTSQNGFEVIIDTPEDAEFIEYYFNLTIDGKNAIYPQGSTLNLNLVPAKFSKNNPDLIHNPPTFEELVKNEKYNFKLNVDNSLPTSDVVLYYTSDGQNYFNRSMQFKEKDFEVEITIPKDINQFSYHFEIQHSENKIIFPDEFEFNVHNESLQAKYNNSEIQEIINQINEYSRHQNEKILFAFSDLNGEEFGLRENELVGALSTIKTFVMIETYNQLNSGRIKKTDFVSRYGFSGTVDYALKQMMHYSNNSATGALIHKVGGVGNINRTIKYLLGDKALSYIDHTPLFYSVEGFRRHNVTTASEQLKIMQLLYEGKIFNKKVSDEMIVLMEGCADYFNVRSIPGIQKLSMKTGYQPGQAYGLSGVVTTNAGKYAFSIYTDDFAGARANRLAIRNVLSIINNYFLQKGKTSSIFATN